MWPHRRQPTRLPRPWDSPGKNAGVGCYFLLQCMKVKSESEVAHSCPTLSDPMGCSLQAPPSMGFSRQEYWSGVPLPSPKPLSRRQIFQPGNLAKSWVVLGKSFYFSMPLFPHVQRRSYSWWPLTSPTAPQILFGGVDLTPHRWSPIRKSLMWSSGRWLNREPR